MKRRTTISLAVAAAGALAAATFAYAAHERPNDALSVLQARISLVQAVASAEQHVQGKAASAEYEHGARGGVYDVEVVSANKVFDVKVDATDGKVIASVEDRNDREDDHDD
ncbi:PepSY domain-containing protein [Janthinobacterium sp.]|uniref:PepSY domain-containing protein n=1 Tax=Janthinobacterium sp. TaxID=1871054 RepID=UPI00293D3946|nr:PepSY domain-containing protein [Janthinobacterium sp.]